MIKFCLSSEGQVLSQVHWQVYSQVYSQVRRQVWSQVYWQVRGQVYSPGLLAGLKPVLKDLLLAPYARLS